MAVTVNEITDNELVNKIQDGMESVLRKQSFTQKRKNTIFSIAQGVLQLGNLAAFVAADMPWYITVAIAIVLVVAETFAHAFTRGPLTPSAAKAVENEILRKEVTNVNGGEGKFSSYVDV